ncbi:MAG: class IV adenylate cyclase [Candidatus Komeilibacteria bacterium]
MTLEVEIKYKVKDKKKLVAKLKLIGARFIVKTHLKDVYFSPDKGKRFIDPNPRLRIRNNMTDSTARLEYHVDQGRYSVIETEVNISDGQMMKLILKNLDFKEEGVVDKVRNSYQYKNFNLDLDIVKGLGTFLEIELLNPLNSKQAIYAIKEIERDLSLSKNSVCQHGYLFMVLKKRGLL